MREFGKICLFFLMLLSSLIVFSSVLKVVVPQVGEVKEYVIGKQVIQRKDIYYMNLDTFCNAFDVKGIYDPYADVGYIIISKDVIKINGSTGALIRNFIKPFSEYKAVKIGSSIYIPLNAFDDYLNLSWKKFNNGVILVNEHRLLTFDGMQIKKEEVNIEFKGALYFGSRIAKDIKMKDKEKLDIIVVGIDTEKSGKALLKYSLAPFDSFIVRTVVVDPITVRFEFAFRQPFEYIVKTFKTKNTFTIHLSYKWKNMNSMTLTNGVVWRREKVKFHGMNLMVNTIEIDTLKAKVSISPVISTKGIGYRETLVDMCKRSNAIAGINANYYDPNTNTPIGLIVKDGKVLSSPYAMRPIFLRTRDNKYYMISTQAEVNISLGETCFLVSGVNTTMTGEVCIFTSDYKIPLKNDPNYIYYVIKDNRVSSIGYVSHVPQGDTVVKISRKYKAFLMSIKVGDHFDTSLSLSGFDLSIEDAISGGPLLLKDGQYTDLMEAEKFDKNSTLVNNRTPRTIIGFKPMGKILFLVVDGYQKNSKGLNLLELAEYLKTLGVSDAMCLDGGKSSSMVVKNEIANNPSGGKAPSIPVGIVIKSVDNYSTMN